MSDWEIIAGMRGPDHPEYILVARKGAEDDTYLSQEEYDDLRTRLGLGPGVSPENRASIAIQIALEYSAYDGEHHKMWVIDQMLRELAGDKYEALVAEDPSWDPGVAP